MIPKKLKAALALAAAVAMTAVPARAEPLAKDVFGSFRASNGGPAQAIGGYSRGCAAGNVQLPESGPTWQAMRLSRNRNWGQPQLVDFLVGLSQQATRYGWAGLYIGDMSQPMGGPMVSGHASHQIGLDADIWMLPPSSLRLSPAQRESISSQSVVRGGVAPSGLWSAAHHQIIRAAASDPRVVWAERMDADLMARSPALVWRNATRVRLITAFRAAHGAPGDLLLPGEPLVCDGIELPLKHRKKRIDLEARGLIKGAQVVYLGPGRKPGFSRLHVIGAPEPRISAASIIKIETPDVEEPFIPFAARMGATFLHGAAVTIHKAQGSQWPDVQVFAPDLSAAAWSNRTEAGLPLWKRLAYVAITRAQERLFWVTRAALARPRAGLSVDDLAAESLPLELSAPESEAE